MSEQIVASFREAYTQSINQALRSGTTIVLPSELAAEFWRREPLRSGVATVVREDRIISWDRFKEQAFDLRTELLPVNRTLRALFVDGLLARHGRSPVFERLVPPTAAAGGEGFRAFLTRILPAVPHRATLAALPDTVAQDLSPLLRDLAELERRYTSFLDEHGLFEPAWLERAPAYQGGDHLLVMPDLAEDFPEFEAALAGVPRAGVPRAGTRADASDPAAFAAASEAAGDPLLPELHLYEDSRRELGATLGAVSALLDAGAPPESIVITVCDLENLRTRIAQAAELAEVPLSFRQGVPLAGSAPGRFLASMADVVGSGFSLESLKGFLLNRAVPWQGYARNANLVLAGARAGCLGGRGRPDPRWRALEPSPERDLIELLIAELPGIVQAPSAAQLRTRLFRLLSRLIDRDAWSEENERLLQRSLEELRSLAGFEEVHGIRIDTPYRFWMDRLSEQLYVPRGEERGVPVLPYRVGAGLYPDHHFIVNATNAATRVVVSRFPFLTEAEQESLGEVAADRDLSDRFVRAYAVSGRRVTVSCSKLTWDGPALPPGEWVAARRIVPAARGAAPQEAWRAEEEFGELPRRVFRLQREATRAYTAGTRSEGSAAGNRDLTRVGIADPELVLAALRAQRHRRRPELISLSSADIESFRACPFGYLLWRVLGLRELDFSVDPDSAREIGTLYHDTLEAFFRELHDSGTAFDPEARDAYRARLVELLRERVDGRGGMVPRMVWRALVPLADRVFEKLLDNDAQLIPGHRVEFVEEWEQELDPDAGVYLVGRVDRVTRDPNGDVMIVDYKKRKIPSGSSQAAQAKDRTGVSELPPAERAAERDRLGAIQIPLYIRLLEASGKHVGAAAHYSLEEGTAHLVVSEDPALGTSAMSVERMEEIKVLVDDIVRETAGRLIEGDYRCDDDGCEACAFRGVCRTRFVVRDE